MSETKFKVSGDAASGIAALGQTNEALGNLTNGAGIASRALSGDLVGAVQSSVSALRGLWRLVVTNPWVAAAAAIGLVISKLVQLRMDAAQQAAEALKGLEDRVLSLRKALGDLSTMTATERIAALANKGDVAGLNNEVENARAREEISRKLVQASPSQENFARYREAQLLRSLAEQKRDAAVGEFDKGQSQTLSDEQKKKDEEASRVSALRASWDEKRRALTMAGLDDDGRAAFVRDEIATLEGQIANMLTDGALKEERKNLLLDRRIELLQIENQIAQKKSQAEAAKASEVAAAEMEKFRRNLDDEDAIKTDVEKRKADQKKTEDERRARANQRGAGDYLQDLRDAAGAGTLETGPALAHTKRADAFRERLGGSFADHLMKGELTRQSGLKGGAYGRADTRAEQLQQEHNALLKRLVSVTEERLGVAE